MLACEIFSSSCRSWLRNVARLSSLMAARGRSRMIPRERNQRGFAFFLLNLKSVLNLLISEHELETEVLLQTRYRLLDGWGIPGGAT